MLPSPKLPIPHPKVNMRPQAISTDRGTRGTPSGIKPDTTTITPVQINERTLLLSNETAIVPKINGFKSIVFHVTLEIFAVLSNIAPSYRFDYACVVYPIELMGRYNYLSLPNCIGDMDNSDDYSTYSSNHRTYHQHFTIGNRCLPCNEEDPSHHCATI